ncbi:MAG: hypothetical protein ACREJG_00650 [Candidatus Rokuibacteriota bacterium]
MRRVGLLLLSLSVLATGCAREHFWFKSGATAQNFYRDSLECVKETSALGGESQKKLKVNKGLYRACLYARGYVREARFQEPKDGWRGM